MHQHSKQWTPSRYTEAMRWALEVQGMTQVELALKVWPDKKLKSTHLNKIVNSQQVPHEATSFAIAQALGYAHAEALRADWIKRTGTAQTKA